MKKLFSPDSAFTQVVTNLGTLLWLDLLWLLCCIPVVTIGASTAALYRMVFNLRAYKSCRTADFFRAFASNFKQGTAIWLLMLLGGVCLWLLYAVIGYYEMRLLQLALLAAFFCFLLLYLAAVLYAFPLTCYFENTVKGTLSNALVMALSRPARTAIALVLALLPVAVLLFMTQFFLQLLVLFVLVVPAVLAYAIASVIGPVLEAYVPKDEKEETES